MTSLLLLLALQAQAHTPLFESRPIFPPEGWHNHSSSIAELPNGDLIACWFHGSGERTADDVVIMGARWNKDQKAWTKPFLLADTPLFPDTNPVLYLDARKKLWLLWPAILANEWHTALMKYRVSSDYLQADGPPKWERADNILLIPRRMAERTNEVMTPYLKHSGPIKQWAAHMMALAGDKYFSRVGWFTRAKPLELPSGRMLVPMYSDGYSFGIIAISDDHGESWFASEPIVGFGNIQPSLARRRDGTLIAYMRDNGPAPKRILSSESKDDGLSWTEARDTDLPNPGTSVALLMLKTGEWLLVSNDLESGRHSLLVSLSDDEGKTWKWSRHLGRDTTRKPPDSFHYPFAIQAADGSIHVSYSWFQNAEKVKTIVHARFDTAWVKAGDPR